MTQLAKLDSRAKRIVRAGLSLYGVHWYSDMARACGLSQTFVTLIANGARPVSDSVQKKFLDAMRAERKRLKTVSADLTTIINEIVKEKNDAA